MSAWQIGTSPTRTPVPREEENPVKAILDKITKWIPGDVLAIFVAGVTAMGAVTGLNPSVPWLIGCALLTPVVVYLAVWAKKKKFTQFTVLVKAVLAMFAFLIWSVTVPASGWQAIPVVSGNPAIVTPILAAIGLLYGLIADGIVLRLPPEE